MTSVSPGRSATRTSSGGSTTSTRVPDTRRDEVSMRWKS